MQNLKIIREKPLENRTISLYGWLRGTFLNNRSAVHIPGMGDLIIKDVWIFLQFNHLPVFLLVTSFFLRLPRVCEFTHIKNDKIPWKQLLNISVIYR